MKYKRILIKISGEALLDQKNHYILDFKKLKKVSEIIKKIKKDIKEIAIVIGGGNIFRGKQSDLLCIDKTTGDYMGMISTIINAIALKKVIEKNNLICSIMSNIEIKSVADFYVYSEAEKRISNGEIVIFAGGTGNPYFTTDTAVVLKAIEIDADAIFMIKNGINGIYTSDPNKNKNAKLIKKISYQEVFDKKLKVMDLTALTLLITSNKDIKIHVFSLEYDNFCKLMKNENVGTIVSRK